MLEISLSDRFLPVWLSAILFITIPINNIVNVWATYLRCHKKEPFLIQAISIGLICALSTILNAKYFGTTGVVISYTIVILFINLPLSYFIFKSKRREYHN